MFHKRAQKDAQLLAAAGLRERVDTLLAVLREVPLQNPPAYEKLLGNMTGSYSRRITRQHRLVYQVNIAEHKVRVLRMWTHYE
jgi:toxin YoeB